MRREGGRSVVDEGGGGSSKASVWRRDVLWLRRKSPGEDGIIAMFIKATQLAYIRVDFIRVDFASFHQLVISRLPLSARQLAKRALHNLLALPAVSYIPHRQVRLVGREGDTP